MPKIHFTDAKVKQLRLPAGKSQVDHFETILPGRSLILTVNKSGRPTWSVLFYGAGGKPKRRKLGAFPELAVKQARQAAVDFDVKTYLASGKAGSFKEVAEAWLKRHVRGRLRTEHEIERQLHKYVYPSWADRPFTEIRRADVNLLLDKIEDEHGVRQADCVLTTIRSMMVWHQSRDEDYTSPIVKGMKRDKRLPEQKTRDRILDDDEIRRLWAALDEIDATFASIIKLALITAQRRDKIVNMRWGDLDLEAGTWHIPTEDREKGNAGVLCMPAMALEIIKSMSHINDSPYVFAVGRHRKREWPRFSAWSQRKAELDKLLPIPDWTVHDLRRTARSLMARIGVLDHVAERTLGHRQPGIPGIYNRHDYTAEKSDAVSRLAGEIERILNPGAKVITLRG